MSLIDNLYAYALTKFSSDSGAATVLFNGSNYNINPLITSPFIDIYGKAKFENGAGSTAIFLPGAIIPTTIANTDYIALVNSAFELMEKISEIYKSITILIGNGTITSTAQIDSTWSSLFSTYASNRITELTIENIVASLPQPLSISYPSRSLNTAYQLSMTRNALVAITVDISATLTLSGGQTGTVILEIANDSGFTSGVQTVQSAVNGNTGALTIGLSLTQTASATLTGIVPLNKYYRIRTVITTGTPAFTMRTAQETLL